MILLAVMIAARYIKQLVVLLGAWLLFGAPAQALTIDAFETPPPTATPVALSSSASVGVTRTLYTAASGAVGGGRSFLATKTGSGVGVSRLEIVDGSLGYTQGAHAGRGTVTWDGDTDPDSVKYDGLGGIDFTQDGASAFNFGLSFFDYPFNKSIQIVLRVYDASMSDGTKFSEVAITLNQYFDGPGTFTIALPFSSLATPGAGTVPAPAGLTFPTFTTVGATGAVDIRNVGAITLTFNGTSNAKAPDIILTPFVTNGRCNGVPNAQGKVLDECSVCLDQSNANQGRDRCGTCFSGPSGYLYTANKVMDACGVCPSEASYHFPAGTIDSCGVCVSGPPSYTYVDNTAVCDSHLNSCSFVSPTKQIRGFEQQLLTKAGVLVGRFTADAKRFFDHKCPGSIAKSDETVTTAYQKIKEKGREVFRKGVQVCGDSCVTVSFASDVRSLTPQFRALEKEVTATAMKVQSCYRKLGVATLPVTGGGRAGQTIADVRQDLSKLIKDCQNAKVCPKH